ncbi:MAG: hypothetical protein WC827_01705 [Candidatus Paceibacterota bacterium]|jgi:hypothetical protein
MNTTFKQLNTETEKISIKDFLLKPSAYYQVVPNHFIKIGRPTFDGKNESEVVAKLQYAFSIGAKVSEACCFAGISKDSFHRYCKRYPEFRDKIELLQNTPIFISRVIIYNAILNNDLKISKWYLEKKCPEEFSYNRPLMIKLKQKEERIEYLEGILKNKKILF